VFTTRPTGLSRLFLFASSAGLFAIASARAGTVAFWRFEEGPAGSFATGPILDSSGNGLNGTPFGNPIYVSDSGSVPGSILGLDFNGTSSRIFVPDYALLQLTHSLTLDAYIRIDGPVGGCCGLGQIVFRGDDRGGLDPYYLAVNASGQLQFGIYNASNQQAVLVSPSPLSTGVFIRVTGSLDDATGMQRLFVNGTMVAAQFTTIRPFAQLDASENPGLGIGNTQGTAYAEYFNGVIDEVNIRDDADFPASPALQLITVAPCRVMDTRSPNGPLGGPFVAGATTRTIPIPSSACGVPANALAYSLNFTVVPLSGVLSYLSVWPAGQTQPVVSTLNSPDGSVLANAAIVPAGTAGAIDAYATNNTDLIVDINGYFLPPAANSLQFYPLPPCRVLDTRNPDGIFGGPSIAGGSGRSFPIPSSSCGTPANAAAYAFNVTVVPHGPLGYLTAWPTGEIRPVVSTLNSYDGTVLANAAIVPAGNGGATSFYATDTTDLVVDINGYFALPGSGGLNFYTATPCRLVDTRNPYGTFGGPTMGPGTTREFPLAQSLCGLPSPPVAEAYSLNMTVVPQAFLGYLTTWPTGGPQPVVSTLNAYKGQVVANAAIVPAGTNGSIDVYVTDTTDVVIDTNGYFGP